MIIFKTAAGLNNYLLNKTSYPQSTGFVPTMGALHPGHLALVEESKKEQGITVASIFINPTQFNDPLDFEKYPVTLEKDIELLERAGCDLLFLPSVAEIYPEGLGSEHQYNIGQLENLLEGFYRPGHFQGVCKVVDRLLGAVNPGHIYLGRKDYQQCSVVKKLLEITNLKTIAHVVDTVREPGGLAMSSRNMRLGASERKQALSIYRQLTMIKEQIGGQPLENLKKKAMRNLLEDGFAKVDYVEIAHPDSLLPVEKVEAGKKLVVLIAAWMNGVRLIDNMEIIP